ncbi:kinetochore protein Nuf2 [Pancytospora epiphaga]|nr:kinetochore protein Nuf2 [Pancytospora epiphaga]
MNRKNGYAIPDLPVREITSYFAEMGMEVAAAELLKPVPASVQRIYENMLDLFVGPVQFVQEESLQTMRQVQRMGTFLQRIGMPGFTVRDLTPDSKRLISILSTVINFSMFRDNKRHVYEKVSKIADENYSSKKAHEARINTLHEETEKALSKLSENGEQAEVLEKEIGVLEAELKSFYRHQRDKAGEVALLKDEKTGMGDRLSEVQLVEHNLKQEIACLKAQVVSDPTRLMELIGEMRLMVEKEQDSIRIAEESIAAGSAKLVRAKHCEDLLKVASKLKSAVEKTNLRIEELDRESAAAENRLKAWDTRINALKIRINHMERQISHLQSKIYNLQGRDKRSSEEISAKIANLRIKYDAVSDERSKMAEKVQENNRRVQELMQNRAEINAGHEKECSDIISLLVKINGQIDAYFASLMDSIE